MRRTYVTLAWLAAVLAAGLVMRLIALHVPGHNGDVRVTGGWAERMAEVGPWAFYEGSGSVYPALLYPLWPIGAWLEGPALDLAIKGLSIPFDVAIAAVIVAIVWRRVAPGAGVLAGALFFLNPAAILAGPIWGQVDSAGTLPYLLALVAVAARRDGTAGALGVVAMFVKPQFGLVLLPVLVVAALRSWHCRRPALVFRAVGGMIVAAAVVAAPLALHPGRYLGILGDTAVRQPFTSLNAFNPWGLLVGFKLPDDPYVGLGTALLLVGCIASLSLLRRRADLATMLAVGALLVLAFYFLPTRVHERYLFPAIAVLAPLALTGARPMVAYVALSIGFAGSLVYALVTTTPFTVPPVLETWIRSPMGVWAVGAILMGSSVGWVWLLAVRRPRFPRPRSGRPGHRGAPAA